MGPLEGIRILEIAGIGPLPHACMLLADLGADVVRIDRVGGHPMETWSEPRFDIMARGRRRLGVDLKSEAGVAVLMRLVEGADAMLEGFRPGVAERLGIGPELCMARNGRLVYGRMTGWGQDGPLAGAAGHDLNYIALTGALAAIGTAEGGPVLPLNLVGDFGGGSMFLVLGVLAALLEASRSGKGQVVDAAMVDGASALMSVFHGTRAVGFWNDERGSNVLDGGAHFYNVYETKDGGYVSIGSIEPQFYAELIDRLGLAGEEIPEQLDMGQWPTMKERFAELFRTKTRDQWCELLEGTDVCFAPVLTMGEAASHPHMKERGTLVDLDGVVQPAPAPRFSRTSAQLERPPVAAGADTQDVLLEAGFSAEEVAGLRDGGTVG